jgi:hypothetical protein
VVAVSTLHKILADLADLAAVAQVQDMEEALVIHPQEIHLKEIVVVAVQ